jgi:very-short-patch-repair endonuclease
MTKTELLLWAELKNRKLWVRFLRQRPIYVYSENGWLDRYIIPDFYCSSRELIIEVDWSIHDIEEVLILDIEKEELIKQKGINIIRITNKEIKDDINKVVQKIKQKLSR